MTYVKNTQWSTQKWLDAQRILKCTSQQQFVLLNLACWERTGCTNDKQTNINCYVCICSFLFPLYYMLLSSALIQEGELICKYIFKMFYQNSIKSKYFICICTNWSNARTII